MEGIKQAIEFIANLAVQAEKPEQIEIAGKKYCTKNLTRYDKPKMAERIEVTTLTALVDYIKECRHEMHERMIVHVISPERVALYSSLTKERERERLFECVAQVPRFEFGREYGQEAFLIAMQACFDHSEDRESVTVLASNIVQTQKAAYTDDGISQQAVIKTGVTSKGAAYVPNPVVLIPYRTFLEVEQPPSSFVFRVSEGRDGAPAFKLVEADGGRWRSEAMTNVYNYLKSELDDIPDRDKITIIS